jgi:hypothetical protein
MHAQVAPEWAWWIGRLLGAVPLLALAVWHRNDVGHCAAFAMRRWGRHRRARLPPGHMGLPFVGESLALLWYFKLARRPDGFVDARRRRYGAGGAGGVYRTHLFGSPTVLVCSPAANKFVLQSSQDGTFGIRWPAPELVGVSCVGNVDGSQHARLRGFILAAINRPARSGPSPRSSSRASWRRCARGWTRAPSPPPPRCTNRYDRDACS